MVEVCPKCGSKITANGCCSNFRGCYYTVSNSFDLYELGDDIKSEINNSIVIVNELIKKENLNYKPVFYILGGAALVLHSLNVKFTLDIDIANKMEDNIKRIVGDFISDVASEVVMLGGKYRERAVRYKPELSAVEVYILSKEDLLITKLIGMRERVKDKDDLLKSGLLDKHVIAKARSILETEYDARVCEVLCSDLHAVTRRVQEVF